MHRFDASIDLTVHTVPGSVPPAMAVQQGWAVAASLDGTGFVSAERPRVYGPGCVWPPKSGPDEALATCARVVALQSTEEFRRS